MGSLCGQFFQYASLIKSNADNVEAFGDKFDDEQCNVIIYINKNLKELVRLYLDEIVG